MLTTPKNKEILIGIVAGEPSGDLLGAELILALKSRIPNVRFVGIGGPKMIAAGVQSLFPIDALSVRGIVEVLFHLLRILKIRRSLLRYFLVERPKVFIGVDAPDFNLGLEYQLKKSGIPTVHYISPSIWAWRGYRINKIIESVSLMLTVFPFEEEIYKNKNLPATYVGHPLADLLPIESSQADARKEFNVTTTAIVITLMPGSRMSELSALGEVFIKTAYMISSAFKNTHFLVPLATQQTYDFFHSILGLNVNNNIHIHCFLGNSHNAMIASDLILLASGTATLEATLIGRPMVIAYRMPLLSYRIMKFLAYQPWVGLPNILAKKFLVPELLQNQATPLNLSKVIIDLLNDPKQLEKIKNELIVISQQLRGELHASERAAMAIISLLEAEFETKP